MKKKRKIPKAQQIKIIRGALKSRKTPKVFLPSLRKRLKKLGGIAVILFGLCSCASRPAAAQTPVIIQPTQQTLAPAGTACTGSAQTFPVLNKNQTRHYASILTNSSVVTLTMQIFGVDQAGNSFLISDTGTNGNVAIGSNPVLTAVGYYPTVNVVITCTPAPTGTFTLSYSGSSAASGENAGGYLLTQVDKTIATGKLASGVVSAVFEPPFSNSAGALVANFVGGSGPSGSTITVSCTPTAEVTAAVSLNFTLATAAGPQQIPVPPGPCPIVAVAYTGGGASSNTVNIDYVFLQPGTVNPSSNAHITGTTATAVKSGSGMLHSLVIGTPAAGTVTLFDLAPSSCTGTPASNVVSVITATATFPSAPELFDSLFVNGICVKLSAGMDVTVTYQ